MAIAVYLQSGQADVSHIQHKIRLKKLAKLALAAKFITHTIIPIPIPLPIIKRHKHKQEQYKVNEHNIIYYILTQYYYSYIYLYTMLDLAEPLSEVVDRRFSELFFTKLSQ